MIFNGSFHYKIIDFTNLLEVLNANNFYFYEFYAKALEL